MFFQDLKSDLFSPLSKDYCLYFYILTIISFVFLVISVVNSVMYLSKGKGKVTNAVMSLCGPLLLYFNNRLLYSMCVN